MNTESARKVDLTVVVPVRNEAKHIAGLLAQFRHQSLDPCRYEIIVVDGCSEDDTVAIVNRTMVEMPNLRILHNPGIKSSAGRNAGVAHACGSYVLFIDGHCRILRQNMLERVLAAFERGEKCLSRPQPQILEGVSPFQRAVAKARNSFLGHYAGSQIYQVEDTHTDPLSAGCAYRIDLYRELGGVDDSFDACEDLEFNLRVGQRGILALHAQDFSVGYEPRDSFVRLFRQMYRYGYGRSRMARKHRGRISILAAGLCVFSLSVLLTPAVLAVGGTLATVWMSALIAYWVVSGAVAWGAARGGGIREQLQTWSCFWAIHIGGGLGYLSGLFGGPSLNHVPGALSRKVHRRQDRARVEFLDS